MAEAATGHARTAGEAAEALAYGLTAGDLRDWAPFAPIEIYWALRHDLTRAVARRLAREGLRVDSQTLWEQIQALARHLEPTYDALGQRALAAPVINVDETRWPRLGQSTPAAGQPRVALFMAMTTRKLVGMAGFEPATP